MMKKKWMALILTGLLALCMSVPVLANDLEIDSAGNVFAAGDVVSLPSDSVFSAFLAGQSVSIDEQEAKGSAAVAAQTVYLNDAKIGETLYAAGNSVTVKDTTIGGNVWAAGNNVTMGGITEANGIYAAGSIVSFSGTTNGLFVGAGQVIIDGTVNGDATIEADEVKITDNAVITGNLKVRSPKQPGISDKAKITNYSYEEVREDEDDLDDLEDAGKTAIKVGIGALIFRKLLKTIYLTIAMVALGMLLCLLFGGHLSGAAQMIKKRTAPMILSGVLGSFGIPLAALMLLCTFFLAPVSGILALAYVLLLCVGLAFTGASLARLVFPKMNVFLSALIGIAVLEFAGAIPVLGRIVKTVAFMYLLGYVIQKIWLGRLRKEKAVDVASSEAVKPVEEAEKTAAEPATGEKTSSDSAPGEKTEKESSDAEE